MSIHVAKKLTINNFSSLQQCSSFGKYPCQLAEVNVDGLTDVIGFSYDTIYVSLVQSNVQINASQQRHF
jgi:hypothetical protein